MSNDPTFPTGTAVASTARPVVQASGQTGVHRAIADAARRTSVDFDYLVAQAEVESSMNPEAKARTSSASGLYQFIESTWLGTMKRHGARFGLGDIAAQIGTTRSGTAYVADSGQRQAILSLRNDPQIASLMAAGLAEDNRAHLTPILGRQPNHGELYLAHFLGAGGAGRFLSELAHNPNQSAPDLFARPAAANRAIFYEGNGAPRSLAGVMHVLDAKLERALARAPQSPPDTFTPPPYVIADEAVFAPGTRPAITGADRPRIAAQNVLESAPPILSAKPVAMSNLLRATLGDGDFNAFRSDEGNAQVRRAYDRLKALGL